MPALESANYDVIDELELNILTDIEAGRDFHEGAKHLIKGKTIDQINIAMLKEDIKKYIPQDKYKESIAIIKREVGIILDLEDLAA